MADPRVYNNLGILQKRKGNLGEALASYQAALDIDPESFFPTYNIGVLKAHMKDSSAIEYFKQALMLAKSTNETTFQINVHLNLSLLFERCNDLNSAITHLIAA
jgi:tetratricopeptide (TPR) repeat protein